MQRRYLKVELPRARCSTEDLTTSRTRENRVLIQDRLSAGNAPVRLLTFLTTSVTRLLSSEYKYQLIQLSKDPSSSFSVVRLPTYDHSVKLFNTHHDLIHNFHPYSLGSLQPLPLCSYAQGCFRPSDHLPKIWRGLDSWSTSQCYLVSASSFSSSLDVNLIITGCRETDGAPVNITNGIGRVYLANNTIIDLGKLPIFPFHIRLGLSKCLRPSFGNRLRHLRWSCFRSSTVCAYRSELLACP